MPGQTEGNESLLATVPPNVVQSIRAFRVAELQEEAARLEQHFLYAHCNAGLTKQQVLGIISESFQFPKGVGKNFDGLRETLTATRGSRRITSEDAEATFVRQFCAMSLQRPSRPKQS